MGRLERGKNQAVLRAPEWVVAGTPGRERIQAGALGRGKLVAAVAEGIRGKGMGGSSHGFGWEQGRGKQMGIAMVASPWMLIEQQKRKRKSPERRNRTRGREGREHARRIELALIPIVRTPMDPGGIGSREWGIWEESIHKLVNCRK